MSSSDRIIDIRVRKPGELWDDVQPVMVDLSAVQDIITVRAVEAGLITRFIRYKDLAWAIARGIAEARGTEVRWAWKGSGAGHYIDGAIRTR